MLVRIFIREFVIFPFQNLALDKDWKCQIFLQARKALNANQKERGRKFPQSEAPEQFKRINSYVIQVFTIFGHVKTL